VTLPFANRVALVTGGSRGIGRATALRLAAQGADVALSYVRRDQEAQHIASAIRQQGRRALAVPCDVSHSAEVRGLVDQTRAALGPIDLLAHCGAISNLKDHTELTEEVWRQMIDVNLTGAYLVLFAVKDEMMARGFGRIVTVSSLAALRPRKMQIHYATAKAGMIALTRCCAEAFAPHVRVNCVAPGLIETEMMHVLPEERIRAIAETTPLERVGRPEEIAATICFLLSEESSFITGQTIVACGGRAMIP
jgi:3-oxoacyl-[acyl-carrier protein] reductase